VIRAFIVVTLRSFRNRIVSRLKRLRNIRYLISFLVGMAYFWFAGWRHLFTARSPFRMGLPPSDLLIDFASMVVLMLMILAWALPEPPPPPPETTTGSVSF